MTGPDGTAFTYEYFEDANGQPIYPGCVRDEGARYFFVRAALALGHRHRRNGDLRAARTAAVILHRFAEAYQGYPIYGRTENRGTFQFFTEEPYPYHTGRMMKWNCGYPTDLGSTALLAEAYGHIRDSGVIATLEKELGRDVRRVIESDYLLNHAQLVCKYDAWHVPDCREALAAAGTQEGDRAAARNPAFIRILSDNWQPGKCFGLICVGRAIDRPDLVHYAVANLRMILATRFMVDGVFPESPSYHKLVVDAVNKCLAHLEGYSDPPGYVDELTGRRYDRFRADAEFPVLDRANAFLRDCRYPDGTLVPIHDSFARRDSGQQRSRTRSRVWPVSGHAVLGWGLDRDQTEAHLHFSDGYGHEHQDALNVLLWACEAELLPDIGDARFTYRGWSTSTLSHNTVVVDGGSQRWGPGAGGNLLAWHPVKNGFGTVEVEARASYPQCASYRRALFMVQMDEGHAFIADIFNVSGGSQHDWMAHGRVDEDQTVRFDKATRHHADSLAADGQIHIPEDTPTVSAKGSDSEFDRPGVVSQYWSNIRDVRAVEGPGPWTATFAGSAEKPCLCLHLLSPVDAALYTGHAPSLRRAEADTGAAETYHMPILTARRMGENLVSRFVALWEPCRGQPRIRHVELVANSAQGLTLVVEATGGTRYTLVWHADGDGETLVGDLRLRGRYACVIEKGGNRQVQVCDPRSVRRRDQVLHVAEGAAEWRVLSAGEGDGADDLVIEGTVPAWEKARWGLLVFPGGVTRAVRLGRIVHDQERTHLRALDGLGLVGAAKVGRWSETRFPHRSFDGALRLRLFTRWDMVRP